MSPSCESENARKLKQSLFTCCFDGFAEAVSPRWMVQAETTGAGSSWPTVDQLPEMPRYCRLPQPTVVGCCCLTHFGERLGRCCAGHVVADGGSLAWIGCCCHCWAFDCQWAGENSSVAAAWYAATKGPS